MRDRLAVLKIGGSILKGPAGYREAAERLGAEMAGDPEACFLIVVSAQHGETDALERLAREVVPDPDERLLDLLWSVGERRSAALLALHLHRAGIRASALDLHQIGLRVARAAGGGAQLRVAGQRLRRALWRHRVVVVPGFFGLAPDGAVTSLGRGGTDLTAVVLACALGADRCELVKDVPGYFTRDPNGSGDARPLAELSYEQAIQMARDGCGLVQLGALEVAARHDLALIVRGLDRLRGGTRVRRLAAEHGPGAIVPGAEAASSRG